MSLPLPVRGDEIPERSLRVKDRPVSRMLRQRQQDGENGHRIPVDGGNHLNIIRSTSSRNCAYVDNRILSEGARFAVRYLGYLEVNASMKSLDFETRSLIAKECINRICEAAGLKTADRKKRAEKKITRFLADIPNMDHAGENTILVISSRSLTLTVLGSEEIIAQHDMPNISFASGGDSDTLDFVAYVAKDRVGHRACYVLECGGDLANEVITTIGQAFDLRFKEYMQQRASPNVDRHSNSQPNPVRQDGPEYYNDLPGKVPPEATPPVPPLPSYQASVEDEVANHVQTAGRGMFKGCSGNLIDLSSEPCSPNPFTKHVEPEYVNDRGSFMCPSLLDSYNPRDIVPPKDPFDMQPFGATLPSHLPGSTSAQCNGNTIPTNSNHAMKEALREEVWFHSVISRKEAEELVQHDGEFLVRESHSPAGQFVLTGMQGGIKKHLLLIDPEGVVRTKDKIFDNVSHLINYHCHNQLPIISAESALLLQTPICCKSQGN